MTEAEGAPHRLDSLLRPASIAIVGASPKPGSYGRGTVAACLESGYGGTLYLVNPNYREIEGRPCYPSLAELPSVPEHCILSVANARLEAALEAAIAAGAKAATIFASCLLDDGQAVPLQERLRQRALAAGLLLCGGNSSGFYNRVDGVRCQMSGGPAQPVGPVAFIAQSGALGAAVGGNDGRLQFNLTVSSGQEMTCDVADYMDFALGLESTRAIGLFIETIRKPAAFLQVLEQAAVQDVPVVVNKVGRSEASQRFALSHSGALAGDDAAYDAVFERYGVLRVEDPDELVATLQLLSTGRRAVRGSGVVAITDSGGERELLADTAAAQGLPFAEIGVATRESLAGRLEYGLEPENPLDAFGTGHGLEETFGGCLSALLADPQAALGLWVADLRDGFSYHQAYAAIAERVAAGNDKPLAFATCYANCANTSLANRLRAAGVPVLEGIRPAIAAARHALAYRDFQARAAVRPPAPPPEDVVGRWRARLQEGAPLAEDESLALLADFGIPVVAHRLVASGAAAQAGAADLGYPVVLKTAMPGILHKTEVKGVHLALRDEASLIAAYDDLARRLGPRVLLARMVPPGPELIFGAVQDPQFGPLVTLGAGGILVELLRDRRFALPPLDSGSAARLIGGLKVGPLFAGLRGGAPLDSDALAGAFARFSVMVALLGPDLAEVDVNPIVLGREGAVALDALILPKGVQTETGAIA